MERHFGMQYYGDLKGNREPDASGIVHQGHLSAIGVIVKNQDKETSVIVGTRTS